MTRPAFSPKTAIWWRARERGCGARRARRAGTHLPQVGLAARVALEPVLIAALLLADLEAGRREHGQEPREARQRDAPGSTSAASAGLSPVAVRWGSMRQQWHNGWSRALRAVRRAPRTRSAPPRACLLSVRHSLGSASLRLAHGCRRESRAEREAGSASRGSTKSPLCKSHGRFFFDGARALDSAFIRSRKKRLKVLSCGAPALVQPPVAPDALRRAPASAPRRPR